jgi:hypothetical protein
MKYVKQCYDCFPLYVETISVISLLRICVLCWLFYLKKKQVQLKMYYKVCLNIMQLMVVPSLS